jgi:hypothetical protein
MNKKYVVVTLDKETKKWYALDMVFADLEIARYFKYRHGPESVIYTYETWLTQGTAYLEGHTSLFPVYSTTQRGVIVRDEFFPSVTDAAEALEVHTRTIYNWMEKGEASYATETAAN